MKQHRGGDKDEHRVTLSRGENIEPCKSPISDWRGQCLQNRQRHLYRINAVKANNPSQFTDTKKSCNGARRQDKVYSFSRLSRQDLVGPIASSLDKKMFDNNIIVLTNWPYEIVTALSYNNRRYNKLYPVRMAANIKEFKNSHSQSNVAENYPN